MKKLARKKLRCGWVIQVGRYPHSWGVDIFSENGVLLQYTTVSNRSDLKRAAETLMRAYERSAPK